MRAQSGLVLPGCLRVDEIELAVITTEGDEMRLAGLLKPPQTAWHELNLTLGESECSDPRFASFIWTLTWAEEDSGRPTGYFQLTISGRPLRFDLHDSNFPKSVMAETAPRPVAWFLHQTSLHGIAMHIA
jgi:hypothetical protein